MFKIFIERPVLSTVISIIITILGILGIYVLPIAQYPDIAPPTVQISANFPGANAQTVLESVIIPIEEQVNGVEHMKYITSTASNNGSASIQVFFEQGVDPDIAAVHVQNRVSRALPLLPADVTRSGVTTQKQSTDALMWISFYSTNPEYDATFIQNYLNINIIPEIKRISGVSDVNSAAIRNYAMRIWLDPVKLASYKLVPADVVQAINEQSQEAAAGTLGQNDANAFEYVIRYSGRFRSPEQYKAIVIKALGNGQFLKLEDVAKVELDAQGYNVVSTANGNPAVSMGIFQTPGSNAQEIIKNIHKSLKELKTSFPPGIDYLVNYDTNLFLEASIAKVIKTLIEAFVLVFIVVFIFLQDFRSTLIPAIAVPVSIIGTFFFISLFGFSINLLTLFALVLAIGIVVDDAIVVVEAVHAKLEGGAKSGIEASYAAMSEITGAIISITLVMASVFIPITFISGPAGVFYKQFGVTLIVAIAISALNALTLSPALCALVLKPHEENGKKKNIVQRFYAAFNVGFTHTTHKYTAGLKFLLKHKWITAAILIVSTGLILWSANTTSKGFVPKEDRAVIMTNIELPAGASLDRTTAIISKLSAEVKKIKGIRGMSFTAGSSLLGGAGSNFGLGFIILDKWDDRKADSLSSGAIIGKLFRVASTIPGAQMLFFEPPSIRGYGVAEGFQLELLDKFGGDFKDLDAQAKEYLKELSERPEILYAQTSFNTGYPQYQLDINVPRAKEAGVSINSIFNTLQGYIGGIYAADFSRFGKQYRVYVQSLPNTRASTDDLNSIYVKNNNGEMAPITEFIKLERIYGPQSVTRFNLFNAVHVTGATNPGYSSGDAIKAVLEVTKNLPANYDIAFSGLTKEEIESGNQTLFILLLVILFVYFILSGQYESYLLPLAVMLSLPVGMMGAYLTTKLMGLEINIYFQIALIMLIGLLAKNAILIVELSIQKRKAGESLLMAAIDGAKVRFRPILMTSFAFIFGLLPLVFSRGVGAVGDRSIGTAAVGGLLVGTVIGVFVVPPLFMFFQWLQEKVTRKAPIVEVEQN
ncbi:MAG: efflux RND transporter permease subunit [Bacteroidia bacterium]|nr:efflux RND transporter permease subunit [Bacteroidia bacterium]MCO5254435.1 efflux RND transporter permease subunit [Bacteroidota bacterium]